MCDVRIALHGFTHSDGEEVVFSWTAPEANVYTISTEGSDYDTVLYLKSDCLAEADECNDEASSGSGYSSLSGLTFAEGEKRRMRFALSVDFSEYYDGSQPPARCRRGDSIPRAGGR